MQSIESACGTWCRILRKGTVGKCLMNICELLLILGIHICLKSISRPWLKQIQQQ